jgi:hypothetical protein
VRKIGEREQIVDQPRAVGFRQIVGRCKEMQVLADAQVFVEADRVGEVADLAADPRRIGSDVDAVDLGPARERLLQRRQHADR